LNVDRTEPVDSDLLNSTVMNDASTSAFSFNSRVVNGSLKHCLSGSARTAVMMSPMPTYRNKYMQFTRMLMMFCITELAVCSPLVHAVHKTLERWETDLQEQIDKFDCTPTNYIPGVFVEPSYGSAISIVKYSSIMDPSNTPFT